MIPKKKSSYNRAFLNGLLNLGCYGKIYIIYRPQIIYNAGKSGYRLGHKPTKDVSFEKGSNSMFCQTFLDVVLYALKMVKGTKLK
jgi:hypothetical protein